jgi:membrane protein
MSPERRAEQGRDDPAGSEAAGAEHGERPGARGEAGAAGGRRERASEAGGSTAERGNGRGGGDAGPDGPTDMDRPSLVAVLKRTGREFSNDKLTHWAAALTYYAVLSIFPALIAMVSILGLLGENAIQPLIENVTTVAPGAAQEIVVGALEGLEGAGGTAGLLFFVGLAGAIWAASGYIGAFMDASNAVWDVEEGRPIWKKLPIRVGITILMLVLLTISALAVVVTGPVAQQVGNLFGVGDTAVTVWDIAKWPVLVVLVSFMLAVLYWLAPNVRQPGFRWVSPGGVFAVVLWIIASALFAFYVGNFGSYNETYGSLGGVIVFLVWLWITNIVILLGAELNAELERGRQIGAGKATADEEPFLPYKDDPARKSKG